MSDAINLAEKLATFSEHWSPRTVTTYNGHDVMVVKVQGEFVWHKHDDTDDFFLVLKGLLDIERHAEHRRCQDCGGAEAGVMLLRRHCERSEAIQPLLLRKAGLLRRDGFAARSSQ